MPTVSHFSLKRLKVKPKKTYNIHPCTAEMAAMLGCWASHGNKPDNVLCEAFANALKKCMEKKIQKTKPVNTINYHLARLKKLL
ncbi:unnamed protein product [Pneumocystis jirovecii]|uniref:CHCH domain-containing protein n=2 Tax=Pneumocystis jirovecii TaxID=42068 RepID=L0PBF4_PNEJI|nr:uncharacterized protein T551_02697 [Pneumocystis jirovecii RU7]KTW28278.1 hypothetical protein T551_02697 [Pneumocystis jirovecii RU7]CCJ29708.1 unnamed protein product [Pneumocystis jirovecii]